MSIDHVLHLVTTHGVGDPRVVRKEARTMAAAGYRVGLVVPHDADGEVDGVEVHAVPRPATGKERVLKTTRLVGDRALAEAGPNTVFHIHDSDLLPFGIAQALRGRRVVYDAHEDSPRQAHHQAWLSRPLRHVLSWSYAGLEAIAGRLFEGIITSTPEIADRYPTHKTVAIRNFPAIEEFSAPSPVPFAKREPVVAYIGAVTEARGVREMVEAVGELKDLGARLHLGGSFFPASLRSEIEGAPNVVVHGYLGRKDVVAVLGSARAGLVLLHPTPQYTTAYPTKLFEYMAAGLPVVASDFPVIRSFVDGYDCAVLVDPLDVRAVRSAIRDLISDPERAEAMGRRGRDLVLAHYTWASEASRLLAFYDALAQGDATPADAARIPAAKL